MIEVSNDIHLKPITLSDHQKLTNIMHEIYPPAYKHLWEHENCNWYLNYCYNKENLKLELNEENTGYYFVEYKTKLSGILRVNFNKVLNLIPEKMATYIHRIYLSKETQGKGVAKQLFDWVEQEARNNKNEIIWLEAMDSQEQALKFYKKQDFEIVGKHRLKFNLIHKHLRGMLTFIKNLK